MSNNDYSISPASIPDYRPAVKTQPVYLVVIEKLKKEICFIATKYDDNHMHCGKFVGFFCEGNQDTISENYEELIKTMDTKFFVEILFPWNKIQSIRSLIYRHKAPVAKQ